MKSILMSIQPKWCELIASGKKTIEVRKTKPKIETPFKCYIYCTKDSLKEIMYEKSDGAISDNGKHYSLLSTGKVIGEFVCDEILKYYTEFYPESKQPVFEGIYQWDDDQEVWECVEGNDFIRKGLFYKETCLDIEDMRKYIGNGEHDFYGWHISNLVIYNQPKELREFYTICKHKHCDKHCPFGEWQMVDNGEIFYDCRYVGYPPLYRPPQSWCYVEELK